MKKLTFLKLFGNPLDTERFLCKDKEKPQLSHERTEDKSMQLDTDYIAKQTGALLQCQKEISEKIEKENWQDADLLLQRYYREYIGLSHRMADYLEADEIVDVVNITGNNWVKVAAVAHFLLLQATIEEQTGGTSAERYRKKAETLMEIASDEISEKERETGFFEIE